MSNIIDSIQLSGTVYTLSAQTSGGGNPTVELTQAQYDALVTAGTVQADTYYIITDAQAGDLTNYYTKTETNTLLGGKVDTSAITSSVTSASTDNEIPTAKAVFDAIPTGGTGGGKTISAGTNISVTTGETADTINCTIPLSADTGHTHSGIIGNYFGNKTNNMSVAFGYLTEAKLDYSFVTGIGSVTENYYGTAMGRYAITKNWYETAFGNYNNSVTASTTFGDSGNTLFSVGNGVGYGANVRHNAFEIRQNGDIYITSGSTDILLQDHLGGGGSSYSAGTGINITDNVISVTVDTALDSGSTNPVENRVIYNKIDEVEQVTARALNQLAESNEVIARALNDLNDRITAIENQLNNS